MRNIAYVACSRGREDIEVFVESIADLSQIQNRSGDRKASVEMAFEPDQNDRRAELKQPLQPLQRIRSVKAEPPERVANLCRQAAEALEPGKGQKRAADLQEHATRSAQKAARGGRGARAASCLDQTRECQQGLSVGL